ncbi:MAG: transcriptional repressor [Bacteroidaceae bacterium]|nr:transcriptional repressor [Bacteroidaceae bacterium]
MSGNEIEERLEHRGVKLTAMRLLVCQELEQARRPLSLRELEERMPTADRSTIFRTLTLLLQHHLIHAIEDGSGALRYEVCESDDHHLLDDQHIHFYCELCHRTFCFRETKIPQVDMPEGFQMSSINYMVKGLCPNCVIHTP